MNFAGKWMELERIMWSELRSRKMSTPYYLSYVDADFELHIILSWISHRSQGTKKGPQWDRQDVKGTWIACICYKGER